MSLKSRILRIALIALAILGFVAFATFSTFLYNPFEGELDADVAALAPRDVDFFVAKANLKDAFDGFPNLSVMKRVEKQPAWQAFTASPEYRDLAREMKIEETLASLKDALKEIPLSRDPLEIFGGTDLAVAGYFKGRDLAQADWAVYGRANWLGKLGAALLFHPGVLGLQKRGITVAVEPTYVALSGGGLPRQIYITRIRDVVIAATKAELVKAANDLQAKTYEDSFFQSAIYSDHILNAGRIGAKDAFEVYVNTRKLLENLGSQGKWPDIKSQDFVPAFLGRLFQLGNSKDAIGLLGIDEGVTIDLHTDLSSELMTAEQSKLYRTRSFDRAQLLKEAARLAPADSAIFVYLHGHLGDLLRQIVAAFEPALRTNLEDAFRNTGRYQNLDQLVTELDGALKDRVVLIVRPNDYPPDPEGPPHNAVPVPAIALVLWTQNVEAITSLRELIGGQGSKFGLQGIKPNEPGYYKNHEAGFETREYWSQFVPGTGVIATVSANEVTIVTNSFRMLGHLLKTQTQGGERYPRLSEDPRFGALVQSSLPRANALVWVNPRTAAPLWRKLVHYQPEDMVRNSLHLTDEFWKNERARVEDKVLREQFPDQKRGQLTPEIKEKVGEIVDRQVNEIEKNLVAQNMSKFLDTQDRWITYMEAATSALFMVALDPKSVDLSLRVPIPLEAK